MVTKFVRLALVAALATLTIACGKEEAGVAVVAPAPTTPDAAVSAAVAHLRNGNIAQLIETVVPAEQVAKMKADWSKEMNEDPISDEDRQKFAETMSKLTADGAEAAMWAEIEPQFKEFEAQAAMQMPMMIGMGQAMLQGSIDQNPDFNDAQKTQAKASLDALAKWAGETKFASADLAKQSIGIVCGAARELNLKTLDEARALSYDQAMAKAGIVFVAVKKILAIYGLSLDTMLDSVKTEVVSTTGDNAKVKVSYKFIETPLDFESEMVKVAGNWYGKQTIEQLAKANAPAVEETDDTAAEDMSEAAPVAEPAPAPGG